MKKKPTHAELLEERKILLQNHRNVVSPEMRARKATKIEDLRQMTIKGGYSNLRFELDVHAFTAAFSVNHANMKHPYIHVGDPNNLSEANRIAHPETHYFNVETDVILYNTLMKQSFEQRKNFVSISLRCIMNVKGIYEVHLITIYVDECDVVGMPWSFSIKDEVLHLYSTENFRPYRQFYLANEANPDEITLLESYNSNQLTDTELEVLKLGVECTILETADILGTTVSTAKSHRKQAMLKLNAPTIPLACVLAKKLKII